MRGRINHMRRYSSIILTLLVLMGGVPILAACHTTAGVGEDLSATGQAISNTAKKATP